MDYEQLAGNVMRALRGRRSQIAFSRRLGYSTNVAYAWESARRAPTAAEMFRAAQRTGVDVRAAVTPFFQRHLPDELKALDPGTPPFVAALLREIRGTASMQTLADRTELSRSAVSRILAGKNEPRLPVFFRIVDVASRRLLDLLAGIVDVSGLPAAHEEWHRVEALRRLAFENPLSEAVPRFLELDQYAALPRHVPGWIASRLGISREDEERTLRDLETVGSIRWDGAHWRVDRDRSVDTSAFAPQAAARLREHWTEVARSRIAGRGEGMFGYLVFSTDDDTLAAIRELRLRFFRELRALVASSPRANRVAVANVQLFPIDVGPLPPPGPS